MGYFARPEGALYKDDMKIGMKVWSVIGIYPPYASERPDVVISLPEVHEEYGYEYFVARNTEYVIDSPCSTGDRNMDPDRESYNDNYVFASKEDADKAVEYLKECYTNSPEALAKEKERLDELDMVDEYFDTHYDYDYGEDY